MSVIEQSIDLNVPVRTASNQWMQFEEFPRFMEGGWSKCDRLTATIFAGKPPSAKGERMECGNHRTDSRPTDRMAESSRAKHEGVIIFSPVTEGQSKITLCIEYEPKGIVEKMGDAVGLISQLVEGDLRRFKESIESRGQETGAWRGAVS